MINSPRADYNRKYLQDLRTTDPRQDKTRIEQTKGGLLADSYRWIKGDPGKGKTMLLYGLINELESTQDSSLLSFFFCQATDTSINNATAVLHCLIYLLVDRRPSLILYVALSDIFTDILEDPSLPPTCLVIDTLDKCIEGLDLLLKFVVQTLSAYLGVKWIVSSRNWPSIEKDLDTTAQKVGLSLELNEESVSIAVTTYIRSKVDWLAKRNKYDNATRNAVQHYLSANAHGTFL
ncbi:heterokaryon incompatibility protein [Corynascus similis CBS 632.67]